MVLPYLFALVCAVTICLGSFILSDEQLARNTRRVLWAILAFLIAYPLLLSIVQYQVWDSHPLTEILLRLPLPGETPLYGAVEALRPLFEQASGYFVFYVVTHFWSETIMTLLSASLVVLVFATLKHFRPASLSRQNVVFIFVAVLLVGWPYLLVWIPSMLAALLICVLSSTRYGGQMRIACAISMATLVVVACRPWIDLYDPFHLLLLSV